MGNIPSIQIFKRSDKEDLSDQTSIPYKTIQLGKPKVLHARWVHNNASIFTASDDGAVRVYDVESGKMTAEAQPHRGAISRINFDKYEGTLVTASKDGTAKVRTFTQ
jgi:WD40 repeat protein